MLLFNPVKVGLIGCGSASGAYLSRLKKFEILELYACADIEIYRAEAKAEQYKIPRVYTEDELLQDKKIQVVLNLTPPRVHARINLAAVQTGKHLYSDKPLTLTREEAQALLTEARERRLLVGCAPDTFLGGGIQTCRKLIDDGVIGQPIAATAFMACAGHENWHRAPERYYQPGGGPMLDMGPYYLTTLVYLMGPIVRVCGSARASFPERIITTENRRGTRIPVQVPTHYSGILDFSSGAIGTVIQSFDMPFHHLSHIEIYGTKGTISVPDPNSYDGPVQIRLSAAADWEDVNLSHSKDMGRGIGLADMAYAITHDRPHRANGELAFHVLDVMLAFEESSQSGRHVIVESSCVRPAPLPLGLAPGELDF